MLVSSSELRDQRANSVEAVPLESIIELGFRRSVNAMSPDTSHLPAATERLTESEHLTVLLWSENLPQDLHVNVRTQVAMDVSLAHISLSKDGPALRGKSDVPRVDKHAKTGKPLIEIQA